MARTDGFYQSLQREWMNDRLKDVSRLGDNTGTKPAYSSWWLADIPASRIDGPNPLHRNQWEAAVRQAAQMAAILLESRNYRLLLAPASADFPARPEDRTITVSYEPVMDVPPGYRFLEAMDVVCGQVIHDAACIRERQDTLPEADPGDTLSFLYRLAEDVLLDAIVTLQYPGFEGYLLRYRHYLVDWKLRNRWSAKWEGRLLQTFVALRSSKPVKLKRKSVRQAYFYMLDLLARNRSVAQLRKLNRLVVAQTLFSILFDERTYEHWGAVNHRSERFVLGRDGPPTPGENGTHQGRQGGKSFAPLNRQTLQEIKPDEGTPQPGSKSEKDRGEPDLLQTDRSSDDQQYARKLNLWEKRQFNLRLNKPAAGLRENRTLGSAEPSVGTDNRYSSRIRVPELYYGAYDRYQEAAHAMQAHTASLGSLSFPAAPASPCNQFGLKTGTLDEDALYKAKFSKDLFMKPRERMRRTGRMDLAVIVDGSSSMREAMEGSDLPRYIAAQRMAVLFVEAMEHVDDVHTWVYSFSSRERRVDILKLYAPSMSGHKARIGDIYPYPGRQTPEYEALRAVIEQMETEGRGGVHKVYIVLSDGEPEDDMLPRQEQLDNIRKLAIREKKRGNLVIQVALGPQSASGGAYPDSIRFPQEGYPELIRSFRHMLRKLVNSG